jgi:spore protease
MDKHTDFIDEIIIEDEINKNFIKKIKTYKKRIQTTYINVINKSSKFNIDKGEYVALSFLDINETYTKNALERLLTYNLMYYFQKYLTNKENKILVVGLGNRNIIADALGPSVVNHIDVNNHLNITKTKLAALSLGVMAQTGIETSDILTSITKEFKPDLVILIDALATKSMKRINRAIQLNDVSISPGSGVGNFRKIINLKSLNAPLISIGVATVLEAYSLIYDTLNYLLDNNILSNININKLTSEILPLENNYFVTPKSIDEDIEILSNIIARAINKASKDWDNEKVFH